MPSFLKNIYFVTFKKLSLSPKLTSDGDDLQGNKSNDIVHNYKQSQYIFFLLKMKYIDMIRKIVCNFRSKHFSRAPMSQRFYVIIRSKEKCVEMLQYFKDSTGAQLLSTNLICVRKK